MHVSYARYDVMALFLGVISILILGGCGNDSQTTVSSAPTITFFTPVYGNTGRTVTIIGTNLAGATSVTFNGIAASTITCTSATSLQATVPAGNTTGPLCVHTPAGAATGAGVFTLSTTVPTGTPGVNSTDGAMMVWVPRGAFTMGSPRSIGNEDEYPQHNVTVSGFWMYKFEVTVAQYRVFCAATGHELPPCPDDYSWTGTTGWDDPKLQAHPIVNVSWDDAQAYATWAGGYLPTEAQFEYAMRGPYNTNYPWGGFVSQLTASFGWDQTKCANLYNSQNVGKSTWPVGAFTTGISWCLVTGLSGNVFEWCADWYGAYATEASVNPTGPETGEMRVMRGGGWGSNEDDMRGACRYMFDPAYTAADVGFRCVSRMSAP